MIGLRDIDAEEEKPGNAAGCGALPARRAGLCRRPTGTPRRHLDDYNRIPVREHGRWPAEAAPPITPNGRL